MHRAALVVWQAMRSRRQLQSSGRHGSVTLTSTGHLGQVLKQNRAGSGARVENAVAL